MMTLTKRFWGDPPYLSQLSFALRFSVRCRFLCYGAYWFMRQWVAPLSMMGSTMKIVWQAEWAATVKRLTDLRRALVFLSFTNSLLFRVLIYVVLQLSFYSLFVVFLFFTPWILPFYPRFTSFNGDKKGTYRLINTLLCYNLSTW